MLSELKTYSVEADDGLGQTIAVWDSGEPFKSCGILTQL